MCYFISWYSCKLLLIPIYRIIQSSILKKVYKLKRRLSMYKKKTSSLRYFVHTIRNTFGKRSLIYNMTCISLSN